MERAMMREDGDNPEKELKSASDVKRVLKAWLPVFLYCLLLFLQSSFATPGGLPTFYGADKLMHFFAYGFLGALFIRAFRMYGYPIKGTAILLSILLTVLYGVSDEFHQAFVVARTAEFSDLVADAIGGIFGVFLCSFFYLKYGTLSVHDSA